MQPHLLYNLEIAEVSSVDKGAGEGVQILLMKRFPELDKEVIQYLTKRSFSEEQRTKDASAGAALPDGSFPIENTSDLRNAVRAIGRAKDPEKAKAHIISRAKAIGATNELPEGWAKSAPDAGTVAVVVKDGATTEEIEVVAKGWLARVGIRKAARALGHTFAAIVGDPATVSKEADINKAVDDFTKHVEATTLDALTTVTVDKAEGHQGEHQDMTDQEKMQKAIDEAVAKALEGPSAEVAKLKAELEFAKLSPEEQAFVSTEKMDDVAKAAFVKQTAEERKEAMDAKAKSKVDPEKEDLKKRLAQLEGTQLESVFSKRATDIGQPAEFGKTLQLASTGDKAALAKMEEVIKTLHEQVKKAGLFNELGGAQQTVGKAYDEIMTIAKNLRTATPAFAGQSDDQMFSKVYQDPAHRALVERHKRGE